MSAPADRPAAAAAPAPPDDWRVQHLLRRGDDCLVLAHRLSELIGRAPALEEELAVANVALDLLGQGRLWLTLAAQAEGAGRDEDALAFGRDAGGFRNALLVELPNGDFAQVLARQFYFDAWHHLALQQLRRAREPQVAEIAEKALKEVTYHLRRSGDWVVRLGDGTGESRRRMQAAADELWPYALELFDADAVDGAALAAGIGADLAALREPWLAHVRETFAEATLTVPAGSWHQRGGRRGVHTEHLGRALAELQFLQRAYPGASW